MNYFLNPLFHSKELRTEMGERGGITILDLQWKHTDIDADDD